MGKGKTSKSTDHLVTGAGLLDALITGAHKKTPNRNGQIENVLACVDEWRAMSPTPGGFGDMLSCLLSNIDWDVIGVDAIKEALRCILISAPADEVTAVSVKATTERSALCNVMMERIAVADPQTGEALSELISLAAVRAAASAQRTRGRAS